MSYWVAGATVVGSIGGALASKQKAPKAAAPIDLQAEQSKAVAGNTANEGGIEALLSRANSFNQDQNISLLEKAMPGYSALSKGLTNTAQSELADPYSLPKDVQDNIARLAAERGISAGTKGEFNDFSLLRDFGVNSLQYGQSRINQAEGITGLLASIAPKVNPMSPMSFYVTPGQTADIAAGNTSRQQANLNAGAAADNYNSTSLWGAVTKGVGTLAGAYTGNQAGAGSGGAPADRVVG